ncbi:MAG: ABC transporter ATP-binding protein [Rhodocyclaceae bacterium]|nr:MAG: ABC transporter ATP-binding protein [Rhodocyclaceae bacterium]
MMPLLSVSDLSAAYGSAQVLFGVDFQLNPGEVVTLLGRNGMGRTTTVRCLMGLMPVLGGRCSLAGTDLTGYAPHQVARLGIGLVPEGRQIFPRLTVEQNLVATARSPAQDYGLSPWTLERVYGLFPRLKERRSNFGNQLSGGEQQMLAVGRALMTNPRLLILDEATEGLSPLIRAELWHTLATLKREGLAQIVIDKNLRSLLDLADCHFVIEKGKVVWSGSSNELVASPHIVHAHLGV